MKNDGFFLKIPLSCHALSDETNGIQGTLAALTVANPLPKATHLFHASLAVHVVLSLHIMSYHFS